MTKIKKAKSAKQPKKPKKPFKEATGGRLDRKAVKAALKRKKAFDRTINRSIGIFAVALCIISSVLDLLIASRNKSE